MHHSGAVQFDEWCVGRTLQIGLNLNEETHP